MPELDVLRKDIARVKELGSNAKTEPEYEELKRLSFYLATLLDAVTRQATLRPCHVTGTHTPDHHLNGSVCDIMKSDAGERMVKALGIDLKEAPHELHPEGECGWCYRIPSEQQYRDQLIASWKWAGRVPTTEMLEPAMDSVQPGDTELVLSVLTDEWMTWQKATERLALILTDRTGVRQGFNHVRYWKTIDRLAAEGRVERHDISTRLPQKVTA